MRSDLWGGPTCRVAIPAVAAYGSDVPARVGTLSPWAAYACLLYRAILAGTSSPAQPSDVLMHVYSRVGDGGPSSADEPWTNAYDSHGFGWSSGQLLEEWVWALGKFAAPNRPNIWISEYNPSADKILPDAAYPVGILTAMRDRAVNILGARFAGLLWFMGPAQAPWEACSLETQTRAAAEMRRLTAL